MKNIPTLLFCLMLTPAFAQIEPMMHSTSLAKGADAVLNSNAVNAVHQAYIEQFKGIAIGQMQSHGVPASIVLAQGILESNAGQSELAREAKNHFGIKCGGDWRGRTYQRKDDDYNDKGELIESCFRRYDRVEESFFDHSEFLRDPRKANRYGFLFNLDQTDYKGWARGLQASGYATAQTYANSLIELIERYQLYQYDQPGASPIIANIPDDGKNKDNRPTAEGLGGIRRIGRINDLKVVLAREGESLRDIASLYQIKPENILNYNDRGYASNDKLVANTRVFLQSKRNRWRGKATQHFVRDNQSMFDISQQYGVKLSKLYRLNNMTEGQQPANGESISIKRRRSSSDSVKLRSTGTSSGSNAPTAPGKMTPDDDYLFEEGSNNNSNSGNKPDPTPVYTGTPATTGVPIPNDPEPATVTPPPTVIVPPAAQPAKVPGATYHEVVKGDTLYNVSRRYNTTTTKIKQLNNLPDDTIKIGQTLRVQ